jgi:hypothetical protein
MGKPPPRIRRVAPPMAARPTLTPTLSLEGRRSRRRAACSINLNEPLVVHGSRVCGQPGGRLSCFGIVKYGNNEDARFFIPCKNLRAIFGAEPLIGRLAAAGACMGYTTPVDTVFAAARTRRTAAGAATWVAPTCCSERAPPTRDRRIGCMGDLTRKTAAKAPRYSVGRFVSDRKGHSWKVAGRSRRRVVSSPTIHLRFPNARVGRGHCHCRT